MAANIAKWWRTKFLNGYRHFTVVPTDCSDGRPSDTEELLARPDYGAASDREEKADEPASTEHSQFNFDEFECDVSVEGGLESGGQERQEFSFTLYDFDGHGKITKDDIAGLVTTIYETLGSSIKVPHYGSKTIKVKLTVSPDQKKSNAAENSIPVEETANKASGNAAAPQPQQQQHRVKFKFRESRMPRQRRPPAAEQKCANSCSSSCRSAVSENHDDGAADVSEDDEAEPCGGSHHSTPKGNKERPRARRYQQHNSSWYRHCTVDGNVPPSLRHRNKKRSSSLQREELLQIIQANMEKNNLSFQTSRKTCDRGGLGGLRHSHHRMRHREDRVQFQYMAHDPRANCYLDLAGLDMKTQFNQDCHYNKVLGAVVCASTKHGYHQHCSSRGHHRSRSHDLSNSNLPFRCVPDFKGDIRNHHSFSEDMNPLGYQKLHMSNHRARSKSHEMEFSNEHRSPLNFRSERKLPPIVIGHTSSPHHLRHRNREQDQARAMAQVVRWLEQEFSQTLNTSDGFNIKSGHTAKSHPSTPLKTSGQSPNQPPESPKKDAAPNSPSASSVERHEHHHVHEHIHHHYHHYQETPVLV